MTYVDRFIDWETDHPFAGMGVTLAIWFGPAVVALVVGGPWVWFALTYTITASFGCIRLLVELARWVALR